ncbi:MAG: GspB domain-containing protein [Pseudomonadota bacterium]|nr:MAG: GspB domain-containing protein [Pseudomonadota bacterium]
MRFFTLIVMLAGGCVLQAAGPPDPTRPPDSAEISAWFGAPADGEREQPYRLQSVLISPQRRIAVINGQRVQIGDRLGSARVNAIEPDGVVLEAAGNQRFLTLANRYRTDRDPSGGIHR